MKKLHIKYENVRVVFMNERCFLVADMVSAKYIAICTKCRMITGRTDSPCIFLEQCSNVDIPAYSFILNEKDTSEV